MDFDIPEDVAAYLDELDAFIEALGRSAILETARTGACGISRGQRVLRI